MLKLSKILSAGIVFAVLFSLAGTAGATSEDDGALCDAEMEISDYLNREQYMARKNQLYESLHVELITHVVQRGETLTAIANRYGVSVATISESNKIENPHLIHPGQELVFPAVKGLLYYAEEGDTLLSLASKFDIDAGLIYFANKLDCIELESGQMVIIPGAKLPAPPPLHSFSRAGSGSDRTVFPRLIWPVEGLITSKFGARGGTHRGIDIAGSVGTPIKAVANGEVIFSGWGTSRSGYGLMVIIRHNAHVQTLYAHAVELLVEAGEIVQQGDVIARVGTSGNTTGPHLHFELWLNSEKINPLPILPDRGS